MLHFTLSAMLYCTSFMHCSLLISNNKRFTYLLKAESVLDVTHSLWLQKLHLESKSGYLHSVLAVSELSSNIRIICNNCTVNIEKLYYCRTDWSIFDHFWSTHLQTIVTDCCLNSYHCQSSWAWATDQIVSFKLSCFLHLYWKPAVYISSFQICYSQMFGFPFSSVVSTVVVVDNSDCQPMFNLSG